MLICIYSKAKSKMDKIIEIFVNQLNSVRAGRANVAMLDGIKVDYYGSANLISQVASITVLDSCTLLIKPWEKSKIINIEKFGLIYEDIIKYNKFFQTCE